MENIDNNKKVKTFKEYYNDPEFKRKHKEYIMGKVNCDCGKQGVLRCNLSKHRNTQKHINKMIEIGKEKAKKDRDEELESLIKKFEEFTNRIQLLKNNKL